jgi:hypothetical protein
MDPIIEWIKLGVVLLGLLVNVGSFMYVRSSNKDKATKDQIEKMETDLDDKLDGQSERITRLEIRSGNSPTHEDLGSIHEKINQLRAEVGLLTGEFIGVKNLLNTLNQHLLNGGKR